MKLKTHLRESSLEHLRGIAAFWQLEPNLASGAAATLQPPPEVEQETEPEIELESPPEAEAEAEAEVELEPGEEVPPPAPVNAQALQLAEYLYPRMQAAALFREVFDKLPSLERDWVYLLAVHGGELPVEEMRRRCGFESLEAMNAALEPIERNGFVWREKVRDKLLSIDLVGIPEPFVRLIELPPYWQGFLGYHLQSLGIDELRSVIKGALDLRPATRKKQALAHFLRKRLLDPKSLQEVIGRLDSIRLEMFQTIMQRNGVCAWKDLLDSGMHKKFDHVRAERLRELVEQTGLVFVLSEASNKYNNLLMVPRDIGFVIQNGYKRDERSLSDLSRGGAPAERSRADQSARPGVILDNSHNMLRDLVIVCAYIQRHQVKMLNNGGLGRNDLKKIVPLLSHNKTLKYVSFLVLFAICKKLLIAVGEHWRVSGKLLEWLGRGQVCYRKLYEFWLTTNEWNEEYIDGDVIHADNYPQNLISVTELRKLILRMLERLPNDTWIDFETFAQSLLPQVAIEIPGRFDMMPSDKHNRHPILIIESVLAETLYWMGVVILGVSDMETARRLGSRPNEAIAPYDPAHPLSARMMGEEHFMFQFKLTEVGRYILQHAYLEPEKLFAQNPDPNLPLAQQSNEVTVQPNLEIVTPPDLALDTFFSLLLFTDMKKMDIMATLTISRDTLRSGLEAGLTETEMIELLQKASRRDLPETVRQMIGECQSRHGEMDLGVCGGYLLVNDPMRVAELKANSKISPSIKDIFDDKLILINRTTDFKKLARELQRLGYLLHIDSDSLYETNEGLYQVTLRTEELYDLLALILFCIKVEEEAETPLFEDRVGPLFQRLSTNAQERFNPKFYAESIAKVFMGNYEAYNKKKIDEATRKFKKQLNRLMTQGPRGRSASGFKGENPTSDPSEIRNMIKYAIEQEKQIKIQYLRSSGEKSSQLIEPETLQGKKVYAFCPDQDEHHLYALERIEQAAI